MPQLTKTPQEHECGYCHTEVMPAITNTSQLTENYTLVAREGRIKAYAKIVKSSYIRIKRISKTGISYKNLTARDFNSLMESDTLLDVL
jgi:hypothetical protein